MHKRNRPEVRKRASQTLIHSYTHTLIHTYTHALILSYHTLYLILAVTSFPASPVTDDSAAVLSDLCMLLWYCRKVTCRWTICSLYTRNTKTGSWRRVSSQSIQHATQILSHYIAPPHHPLPPLSLSLSFSLSLSLPAPGCQLGRLMPQFWYWTVIVSLRQTHNRQSSTSREWQSSYHLYDYHCIYTGMTSHAVEL